MTKRIPPGKYAAMMSRAGRKSPGSTSAKRKAALERATVHERLVELQSTAELYRKAEKARERANLWTQEEIDLAKRRGAEMAAKLKWD